MLLGDNVAKVPASPRNSTWFTRSFLLVKGWGLGTRLLPYFFDQMLWLLFFAASFYVATVLCVLVTATIQGPHLVCSGFPILKCMQVGKLFGDFVHVPTYLPTEVYHGIR